MGVPVGLEVAGCTDTGCEREQNEDYFCYLEPPGEADLKRLGRLALVADGMGGAAAGQVASRLAAETVCREYPVSGAGDPADRLAQAFGAAHRAIGEEAQRDRDLSGMGTTCTAVVVHGGQAYFAHVGDSRLYLIRGEMIFHLTKDHTAVNRLLESGVITPEQAVNHPDQNVLTAALGASEDVEAELSQAPIPLEQGDVLLLCTDGLWNLVSDRELAHAVRNYGLEEACRVLVETAKARGAPDNVTVQLLRYTGEVFA